MQSRIRKCRSSSFCFLSNPFYSTLISFSCISLSMPIGTLCYLLEIRDSECFIVSGWREGSSAVSAIVDRVAQLTYWIDIFQHANVDRGILCFLCTRRSVLRTHIGMSIKITQSRVSIAHQAHDCYLFF